MSDPWWPHGLQHIRLLCLLLFPRVCSNSCPLSCWYYVTISTSAAPFFLFLPASGSFSTSRLFTSGGWRIGASATASALPLNIQCWFPLGFTGLISLQSKGLSLNNVRSIKLYSRTLWHMTMWLITLTRLFCDRFKMTSWGLKGDLSPYSWSNGRQIETRHQLR